MTQGKADDPPYLPILVIQAQNCKTVWKSPGLTVSAYTLKRRSLLAHIPNDPNLLYSPEINQFPPSPIPHGHFTFPWHPKFDATAYGVRMHLSITECLGLQAPQSQSLHQGLVHDPIIFLFFKIILTQGYVY